MIFFASVAHLARTAVAALMASVAGSSRTIMQPHRSRCVVTASRVTDLSSCAGTRAGVVHDKYRVRLGEGVNDVAAHVIADGVSVPLRAGEWVLQPVRGDGTTVLGDRPAVLAFQPRQHPQHQPACVPQRLIRREARRDPIDHRAVRHPPPVRIYPLCAAATAASSSFDTNTGCSPGGPPADARSEHRSGGFTRVIGGVVRGGEGSFVAGGFRAGDPLEEWQGGCDDGQGCEKSGGEDEVVGQVGCVQGLAKLGA
jgi:hypothetical protein